MINEKRTAWQIVYQLASISLEPLSVMMTYPCSGQYKCLSVIPYNRRSYGIHINLEGNSILVGDDLLQYQGRMPLDNISQLANQIIYAEGLRNQDASRELPGLEFVCELMSRKYGGALDIVNAWHEGADYSGLDSEITSLAYYPVTTEQDWRQHAEWWGIIHEGKQKRCVLALLNLKEHVLLTDTRELIDLAEELGEGLRRMDAMMAAGKRSHRIISSRFEKELTKGYLKPLLDFVNNDNNLCVEIRRDYINIYYRGGNLLRIKEKKLGYSFEFEIRYIKVHNTAKNQILSLPSCITGGLEVNAWVSMLPVIKREMDIYFVGHRKAEREFQQLVVRENNLSGIAAKTDYFICDIEYMVGNLRFDLMAAKHIGNGKFRLALIEMKYADSALKGKSGLIDHVRTATDFLKSCNLASLRGEMQEILSLKQRMGLILELPKAMSFTEEKPEFMFLLANHKPASSVLKSELKALKTEPFYQDFCQLADLKIATANFFGYGLYNECVYTLEEYEAINQAILDISKGG